MNNKSDKCRRIVFDICTILFFICLINLMWLLNIHYIIKYLICIVFGYIFGYMSGYQKKQIEALKESLEMANAVENYYKTTQKQFEELDKYYNKCSVENLELGNLAFNPNTNQKYSCNKNILNKLKLLKTELDNKMKKDGITYYDNPFDNTGNFFKNKVFEVQAYNWNDDICQPYNFKYKDIEISWYKYLGRDTTINKDLTDEEINTMINDCIQSLKLKHYNTHYNKE